MIDRIKFIALIKKINIAHIAFVFYVISLLVSFNNIFSSEIYYEGFRNVNIAEYIFSLLSPIIAFIVGYYLLKKNNKETRVFNALALVLAAISLESLLTSVFSFIAFAAKLPYSILFSSMIIELASVSVIGLILFKSKNQKAVNGFYIYFILLKLITLLIEIISRSYIMFNVVFGSNGFIEPYWLLYSLSSSIVFILFMIVGWKLLKVKPVLQKLYNLFVIATLAQFVYEVSNSLMLTAFANDVVAMIGGLIIAVIVFILIMTSIRHKDNQKE